MYRETYKGRTIVVKKGREWGTVTVTVQGVDMGTRIGRDEAKAAMVERGYIDDADARPANYRGGNNDGPLTPYHPDFRRGGRGGRTMARMSGGHGRTEGVRQLRDRGWVRDVAGGTVHLAGRADTTAVFNHAAGYDAACGWCWLNATHSEAAHRAQTERARGGQRRASAHEWTGTANQLHYAAPNGYAVVNRRQDGRRIEWHYEVRDRRRHGEPARGTADTLRGAQARAMAALSGGAWREAKATAPPASRFEVRGVAPPQPTRRDDATEAERRARQLRERWAYSNGMAHYRRRGGIGAAAMRSR